jgi:hypothetical protein
MLRIVPAGSRVKAVRLIPGERRWNRREAREHSIAEAAEDVAATADEEKETRLKVV